MATLTESQKRVIMAFEQLDTFIGTLVIPVKVGSQLAQLFGSLARCVDQELQLQGGLDPMAPNADKPKLEAVASEPAVAEAQQ